MRRMKKRTTLLIRLMTVLVSQGSAKESESACIRNCSCSAYSYSGGCSIWSGRLQNLKQFFVGSSNEIVIYIRLATSNLPTFKGTKRLLVYDYMPFGSLDIHLFGKNSKALEGKIRYQIALGTARGLAYLHEECRNCIIHYDIKPEIIILEAGFCPKVAEFGFAKLFGHDFRRVLTTVKRTRGYLAPERIFCLLDSKLEGNFDDDQVTRACNIACWCIQEGEMNKPSMGYTVQVLEGVVEVGIPLVPLYLQNLVDNLGHERDDMDMTTLHFVKRRGKDYFVHGREKSYIIITIVQRLRFKGEEALDWTSLLFEDIPGKYDREGEVVLVQFPDFPGKLVSYPLNSDVFREFYKSKALVGGEWGNVVEHAGRIFRGCTIITGEEYFFLLPNLEKEKSDRGVEESISLEYFDGNAQGDLDKGCLCYLSQLEYRLSLPLSNLLMVLSRRNKRANSRSEKVQKSQAKRPITGAEACKKRGADGEKHPVLSRASDMDFEDVPEVTTLSKLALKFPKKKAGFGL
ncbi:hypothetical protein GIB67_023377 [Kingdonia uniflora]|uniref:Protein kinase domain-containing protein n=1 Tax=Kingdonia uniflora TaxID=39325 RepID=A0A7J7LIG4_9MAGN|nr:hypothetical protein GIB67_023377 [Kingdonia uniflora]